MCSEMLRLLQHEAAARDLLLQAANLLEDAFGQPLGHPHLSRDELREVVMAASDALARAHAATENHQDLHLCWLSRAKGA